MSKKTVLVTGAGGFIGGHMVKALKGRGHNVRGVDIKPLEEWSQLHDIENIQADLFYPNKCEQSVQGIEEVYSYAERMGGIGEIERNRALCGASVAINANMLKAAVNAGVKKFLFSSSACALSTEKQKDPNVIALKEEDVHPYSPEKGYGAAKLYNEDLCRYFREDFGIETRVPRFHNIYGPEGTFDGGKEKAPAAICRKVIEAKLSGKHEIDIWGDGHQTRSFCYIDDCVYGNQLIMNGDYHDPINLGSSELVTINQLVDMVEEIAGIKLKRKYILDAPKGVAGRNSDNTLIKFLFNWEPSTPLRVGLEKTYAWIYNQIKKS